MPSDLALPPPAAGAPRFAAVRAFLRNRQAAFGLALFAVLVLATLCAPWLTHYQPLRGAGRPLLAPGAAHPFGTDDLGRDVLAEVLYGERVSLAVGLLSSSVALAVGLVAGAAAGYLGGAADMVIMRLTEMVQVIPRIFLVIITVALFGAHLGVTALAIGLTSWPLSARILRAEFLSRRESEYVMAARVIGASGLHIVLREILPNAVSPLIVAATLNVATAILLEASLAFLGLSDPNVASLGRLLQESIPFLQVAWWMSVFPGLVVVLIVVAVNLVGDGLDDVLNPRRRP